LSKEVRKEAGWNDWNIWNDWNDGNIWTNGGVFL
jgi:hypothetical protein